MTDPHDAIAPTLAFLVDYYTQVDRLMGDVRRQLLEADPAWQQVRRLGDSYETQCAVKIGQPQFFFARYLGHWFAPTAAYARGSKYGAKVAACPRLPFAGVWLGDENVRPELYAGWVEGHDLNPSKNVESQVERLNDWLDPDQTVPPQELTGVEDAVFEARAFRWDDDRTIQMAMGRVPLAAIDGPDVLRRFVARWLAALG